jgi:adenylate kinase family enzyme
VPLQTLPRHIHILGASGSGTTTLGAALAARLGYDHFDTDFFYWEQTDPPFQHSRPVAERHMLLSAALDRSKAWTLSGSLVSWSEPYVPLFDVVIFLSLPADIRMERLERRELERYGAERLTPGGDMHEIYRKFMEWAARYDTADASIRSRALHEAWLKNLSVPVLRIDALISTEEQIDQVLAR